MAGITVIVITGPCPWCDDPDVIDSERCNCLVQCPMGLCKAPAEGGRP